VGEEKLTCFPTGSGRMKFPLAYRVDQGSFLGTKCSAIFREDGVWWEEANMYSSEVSGLMVFENGGSPGMADCSVQLGLAQSAQTVGKTGKERKGKGREGKGREGKERKGKERKGKERKGKERKGKENREGRKERRG
jgi:hypothetical protein